MSECRGAGGTGHGTVVGGRRCRRGMVVVVGRCGAGPSHPGGHPWELARPPAPGRLRGSHRLGSAGTGWAWAGTRRGHHHGVRPSAPRSPVPPAALCEGGRVAGRASPPWFPAALRAPRFRHLSWGGGEPPTRQRGDGWAGAAGVSRGVEEAGGRQREGLVEAEPAHTLQPGLAAARRPGHGSPGRRAASGATGQAARGRLERGQVVASMGHPCDCALLHPAWSPTRAMLWDSHRQRRPPGQTQARPWWQHPLSQAPTMSGRLLLLAVLPALLSPPAATAQKRSQGGC